MANKSASQSDPGQLAKVLQTTHSKYSKQLERSRSEAEKHQTQVKNIESELKTLQADIDVAVHGKPMSVSLLHKTISGTAYIKARCWWHGKQREVQVGTIPAVLERVRALGSQVQIADGADPTWAEFKGNEAIIELVKEMAREKLRLYIVKRLTAEYQAFPVAEVASGGAESKVTAQPKADLDLDTGEDWYARWGMANQLAEHLT